MLKDDILFYFPNYLVLHTSHVFTSVSFRPQAMTFIQVLLVHMYQGQEKWKKKKIKEQEIERQETETRQPENIRYKLK